MLWTTQDAHLRCQHLTGRVHVEPSQTLLRIEERLVLVEPDPDKRPIKGCSNLAIGILPCGLTLNVRHGYSDLVRIDGQRVCLDTVRGHTSGSPPGSYDYSVTEPGQEFVSEVEGA